MLCKTKRGACVPESEQKQNDGPGDHGATGGLVHEPDFGPQADEDGSADDGQPKLCPNSRVVGVLCQEEVMTEDVHDVKENHDEEKGENQGFGFDQTTRGAHQSMVAALSDRA